MEHDKIKELISVVSSSSLSSFVYEENGVKISMETGAAAKIQVQPEAIGDTVRPEAKAPEMAAGNILKSPLVGTFYSASSPDAEPFVSIGMQVKKGQVLGIIEAMKLMNEIESEQDGTVLEVLVTNEQVVEYGQPLFVIG